MKNNNSPRKLCAMLLKFICRSFILVSLLALCGGVDAQAQEIPGANHHV